MAHLANARVEAVRSQRIQRAAWIRRSLVAAGVSLILMIAMYLLFSRWSTGPTVAPRTPAPNGNPETRFQRPLTAIYIPVLIDLSNASPARGSEESEPNSHPQMIPSTALIDFTVQLPIGSEARRYSVMLRSRRRLIWAGSGTSTSEKWLGASTYACRFQLYSRRKLRFRGCIEGVSDHCTRCGEDHFY